MSDHRDEEKREEKRSQLLLIGLLILAVILGGVAWAQPFASDDEPESTPTSSASSTESATRATQGQGSSQESPTSTETEAEDSVSSSSRAAEEHTGSDDHEHFDPPSLAGFTSTTGRKPRPGDRSAGSKAIKAVVPTWAENDPRKTATVWTATWQNEDAASSDFTVHSKEQYGTLWNGLAAMDAHATQGKIKKHDQLWNVGSHSLWRVTVERDLRSNRGQTGVNTSEEVTWDFLVSHTSEGAQLVAFTDPEKQNARPETFEYILPEEEE